MSIEEGLVERIEQQAKRIYLLESTLRDLRDRLYESSMFVTRMEETNEPVAYCEVSIPVRLFDRDSERLLLERLQESEADPLPDLDKYFQ